MEKTFFRESFPHAPFKELSKLRSYFLPLLVRSTIERKMFTQTNLAFLFIIYAIVTIGNLQLSALPIFLSQNIKR